MTKLLVRVVLCFSCVLATFGAFAQSLNKNITLLSNWDNDSLPVYYHGAYNDIWGYADGLGNEYAIVGTIGGTYFINVTDPIHPAQIAFFPGRDTIGINRDFKTYSHYAYGVCDQGNSSLQIFDLQNLPNSVTKVYDSTNVVKTCHTIFIEKDRLYFCGARDSTGQPRTLMVASLTDPVNPVITATLSTPAFSYVHAAFVQNDTAYLSCGNSGLFIMDYSNPQSPVMLQSFTAYPQQGYNHSNWVTKDGKTLIFADETHGAALKVYDISNLENPILMSLIRSNLWGSHTIDSLGAGGSIPHNPYIVGNKAIVSYYHDGVQVWDLTDPGNPVHEAYYDTEPLNTDYAGYSGCWGVYPFLPSKNILASDLHNGLFVLNGENVLGKESQAPSRPHASLFPNPSHEFFYFNANLKSDAELSIRLYSISGELVYQNIRVLSAGNSVLEIDCSNLPSGFYILKANGGSYSYSEKIVIAK